MRFNEVSVGSLASGFNPYFIGLPILITSSMIECRFSREEFQSLFYWITYSYRKGLEAILENIKFQSLFYWITYSYKPEF